MCEGSASTAVASALSTADHWKLFIPIAANVAITIFNLFFTGKDFLHRRLNDRKYQSSIYLYQSLLVDKIDSFISSSSKLESIFRDAQVGITAHGGSVSLTQKYITTECLKLDALNTEVEASLLKPSLCISKFTYKKLHVIWERYYDAVTDLTSKLSGPVTPQITKKLDALMLLAHETFISEYSTCIRDFHPKQH
jgi:hypothetical protein